MNNNKYPNNLLLAADTMKYYRHDSSGTRKTEYKTFKDVYSEKQKRREGLESNSKRISSNFSNKSK